MSEKLDQDALLAVQHLIAALDVMLEATADGPLSVVQDQAAHVLELCDEVKRLVSMQ